MLVQSAIHFALDYLIQTVCRYFEVSISSNKVWGKGVLQFLNGEVFSSYSSTNAASLSSLQISLIFALSKGIEVTYLGEIF